MFLFGYRPLAVEGNKAARVVLVVGGLALRRHHGRLGMSLLYGEVVEDVEGSPSVFCWATWRDRIYLLLHDFNQDQAETGEGSSGWGFL